MPTPPKGAPYSSGDPSGGQPTPPRPGGGSSNNGSGAGVNWLGQAVGAATSAATSGYKNTVSSLATANAQFASDTNYLQQQLLNVQAQMALAQGFNAGGGGGGPVGVAQQQKIIDLQKQQLAIQMQLTQRQLGMVPKLARLDKRAFKSQMRALSSSGKFNDRNFRDNVRQLTLQGQSARQQSAEERRGFTNDATVRGAMGADGTNNTYAAMQAALDNTIDQIRTSRSKARTDYRATKSSLANQRTQAVSDYHKNWANYGQQLAGLRGTLASQRLDDQQLDLRRELAAMGGGGGGGGLSMSDALTQLRLGQEYANIQGQIDNATFQHDAQTAAFKPKPIQRAPGRFNNARDL